MGGLVLFENLAEVFLRYEHCRPACKCICIAGQFLCGRARRDEFHDFRLRQRRFTGEKRLRSTRFAVDVNGDFVIADGGFATNIQRPGKRFVRREIDKARSDFQPAERQRSHEVIYPHIAIQPGFRASSAEFEINQTPTVGEVALHQERILSLNRDVEFPITQRRIGKANRGGVHWRLRCRAAG